MSYFHKALSGLTWTWALRLALRSVSALRTIILARLLTPAQMGAYGVAAIALGLLEIFTESGINVFLIQKKETDKYLNTAWIVSIVRGAVVCGVLVLFAGIISRFFSSPQSLIPIYLIGLVALVRGFANPAAIKFQKDLQFNQEFKYRSIIIFVEAVSTVICALVTRAAYSPAVGLLIGASGEVLLSHAWLSPRPKFVIVKGYFQEVISSGKWVTLAGIFGYLYHHIDDIVVGKMLGVTQLGLYDTAYRISSLPITEASEVFSKVTFPIFSRLKDDKPRLFQAFLRSTLSLAVLVTPMGLALFVFPQIIVILLGPNWAPAIPALRLLAIYGVIRSISGFSSALFLAVGKNQYVASVALISVISLAVVILPLVQQYGISGAALSAITGSLAALPIFALCINRIFSKK